MSVRFVRNTFALIGISSLAICLGCAAPKSRACISSPSLESKDPGALPPAGSDTSSSSTALHEESGSEIVPASWDADENVATLPGEDDAFEQPGAESLPTPVASPLRRGLSLHEAIDTALVQNPDAIIARAAGPVSSAARNVAITYPWNPSVQVQLDPFTQDANGDTLLTKNQVSVTQTFELRHQMRHRQRAANAGWNQQQAVIAQGELNAAVAGARAFFDTLYRKGLRDLASDSADIKTKMAGVVDRRFAASLASPVERITAGVAARQAQRQAELAAADYQVALNTLRVVLNISVDEQIEPNGDLKDLKWLPASTVLEQPSRCSFSPSDSVHPESAWIVNRPDVVAARFAVAAAKANFDLAKANLVPNIATGPTYESDESGTVFLGVVAQMDLPVVNTGRPLVRQRSAELQQLSITWQQTEGRAMLQAQAAVSRYRIAHKLWAEQWATRDAGDKELTTVSDAFENGQASIVEVLTTQDSLIQERQNYLSLLNEISQAAADMVAALAIDPECLLEKGSNR